MNRLAFAVALLLSAGACRGGGDAEAAQHHDRKQMAAPAPASAESESMGHEKMNTVPPKVMSATDQAALDAQLRLAATVAARYPTAAQATADGFLVGDPYEPHVGTHYFRWDDIDAKLDPARPEMLLFDGDGLDAKLVGLSYYVVDSKRAPEGFPGPNDQWHRHPGVCVTRSTVLTEFDRSGCHKRSTSYWMLHAWVVPGFENPDGVFAVQNPRLP